MEEIDTRQREGIFSLAAAALRPAGPFKTRRLFLLALSPQTLGTSVRTRASTC